MDMEGVTTALTDLLTNFTTAFTPGNVVSILALGLGASIALFLGWFGIRKLVTMLTNALRKGKIKV